MSQDKMLQCFDVFYAREQARHGLTGEPMMDRKAYLRAFSMSWDASRAACVVELPEAEYVDEHWSGDYAIKEQDAIEAIEAAGLKCGVKA